MMNGWKKTFWVKINAQIVAIPFYALVVIHENSKLLNLPECKR